MDDSIIVQCNKDLIVRRENSVKNTSFFSVGEKVSFLDKPGIGITHSRVVSIDDNDYYPIKVQLPNGGNKYFTKDGKLMCYHDKPSLIKGWL